MGVFQRPVQFMAFSGKMLVIQNLGAEMTDMSSKFSFMIY